MKKFFFFFFWKRNAVVLTIFSYCRVVIENCIICDKAVIRKGSVLKYCLIGPSHEVASNTNKEKAHLTNSDGFMEIE